MCTHVSTRRPPGTRCACLRFRCRHKLLTKVEATAGVVCPTMVWIVFPFVGMLGCARVSEGKKVSFRRVILPQHTGARLLCETVRKQSAICSGELPVEFPCVARPVTAPQHWAELAW